MQWNSAESGSIQQAILTADLCCCCCCCCCCVNAVGL
jgi:hypothetical protein